MWFERLTANAKVATVLGLIPAFSDTVESEGQLMHEVHTKNPNICIIPNKIGRKQVNNIGNCDFASNNTKNERMVFYACLEQTLVSRFIEISMGHMLIQHKPVHVR